MGGSDPRAVGATLKQVIFSIGAALFEKMLYLIEDEAFSYNQLSLLIISLCQKDIDR